MTKTHGLTAAEIEMCRNPRIRGGEIQRATLAARLRTGLRINAQSIEGGFYNVSLVANAVNRKGRLTGVSDYDVLQAGMTHDDTVRFIDGLSL